MGRDLQDLEPVDEIDKILGYQGKTEAIIVSRDEMRTETKSAQEDNQDAQTIPIVTP